MKDETVAFIGGGNMAEALIRGLLTAGTVKPQQLLVTDVRPDRLEFLKKRFGVRAIADNAKAVADADIVVLAVKPQQMSQALSSFIPHPSALPLIISIVAGVTTARLERELGGAPRVVRVMPNTPALIGAGAAALCPGAHATAADLATTESILGAVGITVRVEERLMDVVTALSGSGPAYLFYVAEAMIAAGTKAGLSAEVARQLTQQTIFGAGKLLVESRETPESLRQKVTSPGGTTEAALKVMTARKLMDIFAEAIQAATKRGKELSGR